MASQAFPLCGQVLPPPCPEREPPPSLTVSASWPTYRTEGPPACSGGHPARAVPGSSRGKGVPLRVPRNCTHHTTAQIYLLRNLIYFHDRSRKLWSSSPVSCPLPSCPREEGLTRRASWGLKRPRVASWLKGPFKRDGKQTLGRVTWVDDTPASGSSVLTTYAASWRRSEATASSPSSASGDEPGSAKGGGTESCPAPSPSLCRGHCGPPPHPFTLSPMSFRWSCSISDVQRRKVHTSLATWDMLAGVPGPRTGGEGWPWAPARPRRVPRAPLPWCRAPCPRLPKGWDPPPRRPSGHNGLSRTGLPASLRHAQTAPPPRRTQRAAYPQGDRDLTVVILQDLVVDGRRHADGLAREVGVEVEAFPQRHAGGRLTVAGEQGEDVVFAAVPGTQRTVCLLPQPPAGNRNPPPLPPTGPRQGARGARTSLARCS